MSNWIVNVEHMLMVNIGRMQVSKIKYENEILYYYWEDGAYNGWDTCVDEILKEYLKEASLLIERELLTNTIEKIPTAIDIISRFEDTFDNLGLLDERYYEKSVLYWNLKEYWGN